LEPCATQAGTETTGKPCNFNVIDAKRSTYRPILVRAQFGFTNSILPLSVSIVPAILLPLTVTSHLSNATVRPGWADVLIVRVLPSTTPLIGIGSFSLGPTQPVTLSPDCLNDALPII